VVLHGIMMPDPELLSGWFDTTVVWMGLRGIAVFFAFEPFFLRGLLVGGEESAG